MSSSTELFYKMGHLSGLSNSDLHSDNARGTQTARPGTIAWVIDGYGPRIVKYVKNMVGSTNAMGELMAYESDTQNVRTFAVTASSAGTTTSIVTTGLTANDHVDKLVYCIDDAGGAGAAPEGETSVVRSNTTTTINLAADYAFSAATAASDTFSLVSTYHANDAANGDEAWTIQGVVLGKDGIQDNQFGWVHVQGPTACTVDGTVTSDNTTIAAGDPIVAGAGAASSNPGVDAFGSDGQELWVGISHVLYNAIDAGQSSILAEIRLFSYAGTGASP